MLFKSEEEDFEFGEMQVGHVVCLLAIRFRAENADRIWVIKHEVSSYSLVAGVNLESNRT